MLLRDADLLRSTAYCFSTQDTQNEVSGILRVHRLLKNHGEAVGGWLALEVSHAHGI